MKKDDDTLPEMARVVREDEAAAQGRWDERWDRLAAGTLTAAEEAELAAMARTDPEAAIAYQAFRPLGEGFQARVAAAIREQAEGEQATSVAPGLAREQVRPATPWWRRRPLLLGFGGLATAGAAVALMLLVGRPAARDDSTLPLPDLTMAVLGGIQDLRGAEPQKGVSVFEPDGTVRIQITPETEVVEGDHLQVRCFLFQGELGDSVDCDGEPAASGAVRLALPLERRFGPGLWRLWVVVGRPGDLPDAAEVRTFSVATEHRGRNWQAMGRKIELRPASP